MISSEQLRAARALLDWSASELAKKTGLSLSTVQRMERRGTGQSTTVNVDVIVRALESAGIEFIAENGGGAGVRFRERR